MNTNVWLATEKHLCRPSAQRSTIVTRNRMSRTAACDLAGIFAAGLASAAFFIVALIPPSEPPRAAVIVPAAPSPAPAPRAEPQSVAVVLNPAVDRIQVRPLPSARRTSGRPAQPSSAPLQTKPQSRIARLIVGDGAARVLPFPVPTPPTKE